MNKLYKAVYPVIWSFMKVCHPWTVTGQELIPDEGVLLCGNHSSLGDPIYVLACLGYHRQARVMAKDELLRIPVLGWLLKKVGVIGIKRGKSDVTAIKECIKVLKNGENLLIFPEGTRVKDGEDSQAHAGAAMLATRTGVRLMPVYISTRKRWFRKTHVVFGPAYHPVYEGKKPTAEDYERIADDLMDRIRKLGGQEA